MVPSLELPESATDFISLLNIKTEPRDTKILSFLESQEFRDIERDFDDDDHRFKRVLSSDAPELFNLESL